MSNKYKKGLTILGILIVLCSMVGISYLSYDRKFEIETLVEANGELSVNYINGKLINNNGIYEFSVTNNSDKDFYYEIAMKDFIGFDETLKYSIASPEASININNANLEKDDFMLVDNVLIKSKSTENFKLKIENNKKTSFVLSIHKISESEEYFFATILKNNEVEKISKTKPSIELAITNEGLIEDVDDYGLTYYFRGNVTNNYVKFSDDIWRIVRINGDGTIRLVLDKALNELSSFNSKSENIDDFDNLDIINKLNSYYESNLKKNDSYIANTKFCKEIEGVSSGNNTTYNAYMRLITNNIPSFNCLGETYRSKIGLMTADEVMFAGGNFKDDNKEYYLYSTEIEDSWWVSNLAKVKDGVLYPFSVTKDGKISDSNSRVSYKNVRPVINIIKKTTVKGNGTLENPYVINEQL